MKFLIKKYIAELFLVFLSAVTSGFMLLYVLDAGIMKALTDQNAHLNFARLIIDSVTPGISQIGFWPPLLHILMAPFASVPYLYSTGLAAYITLLPFLILASIFLYRICLLISNNKPISIFSSILFLLNPYILYYAVTPMSEVLFISTLLGTAYFMLLWLQSKRLTHLLLIGLFVALASVSRYEGLILLPITSIIVLATLLKGKKKYSEIEATYLLYVLLAIIGLAFIVAYSWIYSGNPTTFAGGGWWLRSTLEEAAEAKQDIIKSVQYIITASYYMFSKPLVYISALSFLTILAFAQQKKLQILAIATMLFSPFLFEIMSFYKGIPLLLPEFPLPYKVFVNERLITDAFLNERYALSWIGFIILVPVLAIYFLFFRKWKHSLVKYISYTFGVSLLVVLIGLHGLHFYNVVHVDQFKTINNNISAPSKEQIDLAQFLQKNYDYGFILATRVDNDPVLVEANIPLKNYIHEGNFRFYDQAIKQPWFFARWVIMYNPNDPRGDRWAKRNEAISLKWGDSKTFQKYYTLVYENDKKRLYKLNEQVIRKQTEENGYNTQSIPSLMTRYVKWNTETIYEEMGIKLSQLIESEPKPSNEREPQILNLLYENKLKVDYENGFYVNIDQLGNSESQSYALLQSLAANDRETFQKVWVWTKEHLQRKEDSLFSWQFKYNKDSEKITILDRNSATDADTDIAYALILAGEQWKNEEYITEAKRIIPNIYNSETVTVLEKRYVIAGVWADRPNSIIVNPSYFSPHAYLKFQKYDSENNWVTLRENGYEMLQDISSSKIRGAQDNSLPPNWIAINKYSGEITRFGTKGDSFDYSYDAFRTYWRIGQDYSIYNNPDALKYLQQATIFKAEWEKSNSVCAIYRFANNSMQCESAISPLAAPLVIFTVQNKNLADDFVNKYYLKDESILLSDSASFYDKSWFWFGLEFWSNYKEKSI